MREKIKQLNLTITEMETYLGFSRPTLYKYISAYEKKDFNKIKPRAYTFLKYIDETEGIDKFDAIYSMSKHRLDENGVYSEFMNNLKFIDFANRLHKIGSHFDMSKMLAVIDQELINQEWFKKTFNKRKNR